MNETLKNILIIGGIILFITLIDKYATSKEEDNIYTIELNSEPYKICGKDVYISNYTYGEKIIVSELFDDIEYICNYYK